MIRSMFTGVSGLRAHQTMMDVVGNNIANVNTVGYKTSSAMFQDLLSQLINGAGLPVAGATGVGGTNPNQVGLGVKLGSVSQSFLQGASQLTNRSTDVSIQGDGFLVVRAGAERLFTRNGSMTIDALGRLTTSDGGVVQGWTAANDGTINTNATVGDITMPMGQAVAPQQTQRLRLGGNLDGVMPATFPGPESVTTMTVYDQQGKAVDLSFGFRATAANTWSVQPYQPDGSDADTLPDTMGAPFTLTFNPATGNLATPTTAPTITIPAALGTFAGPITIDFGAATDSDALRQYAGRTTLAALSQDGSPMGNLQSFSIGKDGLVSGVFSNGRTRSLGQISLAAFSNPTGLDKAGNTSWRQSGNSGLPQIGVPGSGGRGSFLGGTLEMANVDLAQEFTNLIMAQRGFQANSRVITSSDEILQDLVNIKR
jgi:flagellar hook protein FlgE